MAVIIDRVPPNGKIVLITGASGFIGSHLTATFLENGYSVRAAVRSQASASKVFNANRRYIDRLSVCVVPDITVNGAYDTAVSGVDGVRELSPYALFVMSLNQLINLTRLSTQHHPSSSILPVRTTLSIHPSRAPEISSIQPSAAAPMFAGSSKPLRSEQS